MTVAEVVKLVGEGMDKQGHHGDFRSGRLIEETSFRFALIHTEISEATDVIKKQLKDTDTAVPQAVADELGLELADIDIRCFDLCWLLNLGFTSGDKTLAELQKQVGDGGAGGPGHQNFKAGILRKQIGHHLNVMHYQLAVASRAVFDMPPDLPEFTMPVREHLFKGMRMVIGGSLDLGYLLDIDIGQAVEDKMALNMRRPRLYGTADAEPQPG